MSMHGFNMEEHIKKIWIYPDRSDAYESPMANIIINNNKDVSYKWLRYNDAVYI